MIDGSTWDLIKAYCYAHGYWLDHKIRPCATIMFTAVNATSGPLTKLHMWRNIFKVLSHQMTQRKRELMGTANEPGPGPAPGLAPTLEPTSVPGQRRFLQPGQPETEKSGPFGQQQQFPDPRAQRTPDVHVPTRRSIASTSSSADSPYAKSALCAANKDVWSSNHPQQEQNKFQEAIWPGIRAALSAI